MASSHGFTACPGPGAAAWEREQPALARWLAKLPRPVGLMACNDDRGREVLEACRDAGLRVPEEIAVVGVDNDELLCELADPPLSSVALNAEAGGYRAAALLDRMMRGQSRSRQRLLVEALHVVTRRSTDIVALDDAEVAAALHFIQDHASEPIAVSDIVEEVLISRGAELRFRKATGRSILAEIRRVRLERREPLAGRDRTSHLPGRRGLRIRPRSYLAQAFREAFGATPARYRRHAGGDSRAALMVDTYIINKYYNVNDSMCLDDHAWGGPGLSRDAGLAREALLPPVRACSGVSVAKSCIIRAWHLTPGPRPSGSRLLPLGWLSACAGRTISTVSTSGIAGYSRRFSGPRPRSTSLEPRDQGGTLVRPLPCPCASRTIHHPDWSRVCAEEPSDHGQKPLRTRSGATTCRARRGSHEPAHVSSQVCGDQPFIRLAARPRHVLPDHGNE